MAECTNGEIRAFLVAGSIVASTVGAATFWSARGPDWFLWFIRVFCVVWLVGLWWSALRELRQRGHRPSSPKSE